MFDEKQWRKNFQKLNALHRGTYKQQVQAITHALQFFFIVENKFIILKLPLMLETKKMYQNKMVKYVSQYINKDTVFTKLTDS